MMRSRNGMKEIIGRTVLLSICLMAVVACGGGGGGGGGGDSSTITSGTLSQGYVRAAIIIADKLISGSLTGNFVLDDGEVTTVSDEDGNFSIEIPANYGAYILYSQGGYVLDSHGEETPAIPMLAPEGARNISPVTTLVTLKPELKEQIGDNYDADIADPNGVDGAILQLAQAVEAVIEVLTDDQNPLVEGVDAQFGIMEHLAKELDGKELTKDDVIVEACKESMVKVLEDDRIIDKEKVTVTDPTSLVATMETAVKSVVEAIDESTVELEDNSLLAIIEEAVETACDAVESTVEKKLSVNYSYLQYRTYPDPASNKYRGWIELLNGFEAVEAADVSKIRLLKNGFVLDAEVGPLTVGEYYFASYNAVSGKFDFSGPEKYAGYGVMLPSGAELNAGDYVFEITPTEGEVVEHGVVFPAPKNTPVVDPTTMSYTWLDGALKLNWQAPDGLFDQFRVVLQDQDQKELLYVKLPADKLTVTIPADWVERLAKSAPVGNWVWMVQTRLFSADGMNYGRGVSGTKAIQPASEVVGNPPAPYYTDWLSLQYRSFSSSDANHYRCWWLLKNNDGSLIDESDITKVVLKNPSGETIFDDAITYNKSGVLQAEAEQNAVTLADWSEDPWSGYGFKLPGDSNLPAGTYTFTATASDGSLITETLEYPGKQELPVPSTEQFSYQWLADGSLKMMWLNPTGDYDRLRIWADDQDWNGLFSVWTRSKNVNSVIIPKSTIDEISGLYTNPPQVAKVNLQTRKYSAAGIETARGISDTVDIVWPTSQDRLTVQSDYIQYRTYDDDYSGGLQGWIGLAKGDQPIEASDIAEIKLLNSDGKALDGLITSFYADDYQDGTYDAGTGDIDFQGATSYSGYAVRFPADSELPAGDYVFKVTSSDNEVLTQSVSFPGEEELPEVNSTSMTHSWSNGALSLTWSAPAGTYDDFRVIIYDDDSMELLTLKVPKDVTSVTIPKDRIDELNVDVPVAAWYWQIQTRTYTSDGMNSARGYSKKCKIQPAGSNASIYPSWSAFQYRTFTDSARNRYQGLFQLNNDDGRLINQSDITKIELKNAAGVTVYNGDTPFYKGGALYADVYENSGALYDWRLDMWSIFIFSVSDGTTFPAGTYTYEATAADGSTITSSLEFPGPVQLPVPDITKLSYDWLADGSLKLTFEMPAGDYDQFRIWASDENWNDLFCIKVKGENINTVTIPRWAIAEVENLNADPPKTAVVNLQTRSYGDDGTEFARGISDTIDIPWQLTEKKLRITGGYLQYRTYGDDYSDNYQGWVELLKGHDPIAESDITDIQLLDGSGTAVETVISGFYATTEFYSAEYNGEYDGYEFTGPHSYSGFSVKLPADTVLTDDDYVIEVTPSEGEVLTQTVPFPGPEELPVVDSAGMTYSWSNGELTLVWNQPAGPFDSFRVIIDDNDGTDILYITAPPDVLTVTIPKDWVDTLKAIEPVENWYWRLQTRVYTAEGMNHARGYSRVCKIFPEGVDAAYYINYGRLQYRSFSDSSRNGYKPGLIVLKTDGTLVDAADVTKIELKNAAGDIIDNGSSGFYKIDGVFTARVYEGSSSLWDLTVDAYSFYGLGLAPGSVHPAGDYTYEVTTADSSLLTSTLEYPGDKVMPVPDSAAMAHDWLADGSLKLTWQNPPGDYEQIRLVAYDQDGMDLFNIRTPTSVNTVTLPKWAVDDIMAIHGATPKSAWWQVQTRSYGGQGFDFARGQSDSEFFLSFDVPSANITVDGEVSDWAGIDPAITDPEGDADATSGSDFKDVYIAKDSTSVYIRIDFWNGTPANDLTYAISFFPDDDPQEGYRYAFIDMASARSSVFERLAAGDILVAEGELAVQASTIELSVPLQDLDPPSASWVGAWNDKNGVIIDDTYTVIAEF